MTRRYQRGTVARKERKCGPDVWVFRHLEDGVRKSVIIGTVDEYPTKSAAIRASEALRIEANSDTARQPDLTMHGLIDLYEKQELPERFSTRKAYRSYIKNYIRPKWQDYSIDEIKIYSVEQWLQGLPLKPKSRNHIKTILINLYNCAMRWDLLPATGHNPMRLVRVRGASKRSRKPQILTTAEFWRLADEIKHEPTRTMAIVAICLGLRISELAALKWGDFDFLGGTVLIERAIVSNNVDRVKTVYSEATQPVDGRLAEILLRWRAVSPWKSDQDWCFASPANDGKTPYSPYHLQQLRIRPAAKAAGLGEGIGWHTFRHSYSSMLRALEVDVKVQQELLRHADARTTLNTYSQALEEKLREANSRVVGMVLQ